MMTMVEKSTIEKIRMERSKMQMNAIIQDLYQSYEHRFELFRQPRMEDRSKEKNNTGAVDICRQLLALLGCRRGVRVKPVT
ncbi:Oidioi.mRNA.OKI2018_I69.chr2.g6512.t1.cds [Oikopleura dioica]|uniref:Oidioi.mRNA.OKI2018_I69.chr2.g6512.t1.cds n=1 Tax=Oikopleura dioica TaxID=34765 RepID=A0ABN7T830_OIKDI|nr:Oidioi.mRNA.OKI2018_I69.chr2.g6512.t1.cds [Oikopleura dioica]